MCGLEAILACFSLSGFYIDADISYRGRGEGRWIVREPQESDYPIWTFQDGNKYFVSRDTTKQNPYGRISIGYSINPSDSVTIKIYASHQSSFATNKDRGNDELSLGITWRPFK